MGEIQENNSRIKTAEDSSVIIDPYLRERLKNGDYDDDKNLLEVKIGQEPNLRCPLTAIQTHTKKCK